MACLKVEPFRSRVCDGTRCSRLEVYYYWGASFQVVTLYDAVDTLDVDAVVKYIVGLQTDEGGFMGDKWGEVDTRFSFCAITCLALLVSTVLFTQQKLPSAIYFGRTVYIHL